MTSWSCRKKVGKERKQGKKMYAERDEGRDLPDTVDAVLGDMLSSLKSFPIVSCLPLSTSLPLMSPGGEW